MGEFIELLGWVTALALFGALSNYFLKVLGRDYVRKLPSKYDDFADAYRRFMKFMVRRHRYFGFVSLAIFPVHAGLVIMGSFVSLTGLLTALLLVATAGLGIYGYYFKKNLRAGWLPVHRACAFAVFFALLLHIVYKAGVML